MESVRSSSALDRATPKRLWSFAILIAAFGVAVRVIWFRKFESDLPFSIGDTLSGHAWALDARFRAPSSDALLNSYDITRGFAPGYGALLHGIVALAGGPTASNHTISVYLLAFQSIFVAIATLLTFALARRVLFGYAALVPPALMTASIALLELPGGFAPSIPVMLLLVLAVWQITLLRELLPEHRGLPMVLLTMSAGFTLGIAALFNPAVLILAPLVLWWAFRGIGSEHATLLLVAVVLIPASWLAVAQATLPGGIPTDQVSAWIQQDAGNLPDSLNTAGERAYSVITPWNARFARGAYASRNWNYEWVNAASERTDSSWVTATRGIYIFVMIAYVTLILLGLIELFAEGAGSSARLLALPVITLPLATFLTPLGDLTRVPIIPFLMIALTLGAIAFIENSKPHTRDRRAKSR